MITVHKNMILGLLLVAIVFVATCAQQRLLACQIVDSKPTASISNLLPAVMREAAFSADESKVVTWEAVHNGSGGTRECRGIQVWDVASNEITSVDTLEGKSDPKISTCIPVFDPTGKFLAFSDKRRHCIVILDTSTGKEVSSLSSGENIWLQKLHFLLDGNYLVAIGTNVVQAPNDSIFQVWNTRTWEELTPTVISNTYSTKLDVASAAPFLFDTGKLLVTWKDAYSYHDLIQGTRLSANTSIREEFRKLDGRFVGSSVSYAFSNSVAHAHACTQNGQNNHRFGRLDYDLETGNLVRQQSVEVGGEVIGQWFGRTKASSIGDTLTSIDTLPIVPGLGYTEYSALNRLTPNRLIKDGRSVLFFDGGELEPRYTLMRSPADLYSSNIPLTLISLDVYKGFTFIPRVSRGGTVACYRQDAAGLHQVALRETKSPVLDLVNSRSGNLVAAICGGDGTNSVVVLSLPAVNEQAVLNVQGSVSSVAISDDDALVAVALNTGSENLINIYNSKTGEVTRTLKSDDFVPSLAFNSDSTLIAAGGTHNGHTVWNLRQASSPTLLSIGDHEIVFDPVTGKKSAERERQNHRSKAIVFQKNVSELSLLSISEELQVVEWEKGKQKSLSSYRNSRLLRADGNDTNVFYIATPRLRGNDGLFMPQGSRQSMAGQKHSDREIAALDIARNRIVKRFSTKFVREDALLFDLDPVSGLVLGTEVRKGEFAPLFTVDGHTGKESFTVDTPMQYVNDAVCMPNGLFIAGGQVPARSDLEIVELKSGATIRQMGNQSVQSFGSCRGFSYLITREVFPKTDKLHLWRLDDGTPLASISHSGLQRVLVSPSEERVAIISGDAISVWSVPQLKDGVENK